MKFESEKRSDLAGASETSLGAAGDFHRQVTLLASELVGEVEVLRALMNKRKTWSHTAIVERGVRPTLHIECSSDGIGEPIRLHVVRGVEILRGEALRREETAIAKGYADADKAELGLPPEATNGEFLAAIARELERDPMRAMFLIRAVGGIEKTGEAYSDLAQLGRYTDQRGDYRLKTLADATELEVGQSFELNGALGGLQVFGALGAERRYRLDLGSHDLVENHRLADGESWSNFVALTPQNEEEAQILADLNDISVAISTARRAFTAK